MYPIFYSNLNLELFGKAHILLLIHYSHQWCIWFLTTHCNWFFTWPGIYLFSFFSKVFQKILESLVPGNPLLASLSFAVFSVLVLTAVDSIRLAKTTPSLLLTIISTMGDSEDEGLGLDAAVDMINHAASPNEEFNVERLLNHQISPNTGSVCICSVIQNKNDAVLHIKVDIALICFFILSSFHLIIARVPLPLEWIFSVERFMEATPWASAQKPRTFGGVWKRSIR